MGARGRERAETHYAAETNYPLLLDTLSDMARKPLVTGGGNRVLGTGF